MIRSAAQTLALLLAPMVALVAVPVAAHAERVVLADETADVWSPEGANGFTAEGSVANSDIKRTWVRHQRRFVVVKARYVDLKKDVSDEITFHAYLRTDKKRLYQVLVQIDARGRGTSYALSRYRTQSLVDCDGLAGKTRFGVDTMRVAVPRKCLDAPQWIRFQGKAESYVEEDGLFIDDAQVAEPKSQYATNQPWTKRLLRG